MAKNLSQDHFFPLQKYTPPKLCTQFFKVLASPSQTHLPKLGLFGVNAGIYYYTSPMCHVWVLNVVDGSFLSMGRTWKNSLHHLELLAPPTREYQGNTLSDSKYQTPALQTPANTRERIYQAHPVSPLSHRGLRRTRSGPQWWHKKGKDKNAQTRSGKGM